MGLMRAALLRGSESRWLEGQFRRRSFAKKAVSRFMPGETPEDALRVAKELEAGGIETIVTCLGENVVTEEDANGVHQDYLAVVEKIHQQGLRTHPSVKLTHMGLDVGDEVARRGVAQLAAATAEHGSFLWVDMEYARYVDQTLDLLEAVRADHDNVGVCLQAYLHRTPDDLRRLAGGGVPIRLVKGAYKESPDVAIQRKADVDQAFYELGVELARLYRGGQRHGLATHDVPLIRRIQSALGPPTDGEHPYEVQMLYGIQRPAQRQLADDGVTVRILISYGDAWFPWYMRRLAERPANVGFVLKSVLSG